MSREQVDAICSTMPGAVGSGPQGDGHDAWRIGEKMFACFSAITPSVSVKTDSIETAAMLIEVGVASRAPYFHQSWVSLSFSMPEGELRHHISNSYRLVRSGLTRKAQAALPPLV